MNKAFILCLGSPKTGTTSLYNALGELPSVDFGLIKEYHVLDALYVKECRFSGEGLLGTNVKQKES